MVFHNVREHVHACPFHFYYPPTGQSGDYFRWKKKHAVFVSLASLRGTSCRLAWSSARELLWETQSSWLLRRLSRLFCVMVVAAVAAAVAASTNYCSSRSSHHF